MKCYFCKHETWNYQDFRFLRIIKPVNKYRKIGNEIMQEIEEINEITSICSNCGKIKKEEVATERFIIPEL
jgi:hypothetical protein